MLKVHRRFRTLALALMIVLFVTSALGEASQFSAQDLNVNATYAGATPDEVRAAIGEPSATDSTTVAATGETMDTWQYGGLSLAFIDGKLARADWTDATLNGPRGIRIGDSIDTVKNAFYVDATQTSPDVMYTSGWVEALRSQLPPCGFISRATDGTASLIYMAPVQPYSAEVLADTTSYVYQSHATLTFIFAADTQALTQITWTVGALAE